MCRSISPPCLISTGANSATLGLLGGSAVQQQTFEQIRLRLEYLPSEEGLARAS